jgi:hypothetical protein
VIFSTENVGTDACPVVNHTQENFKVPLNNVSGEIQKRKGSSNSTPCPVAVPDNCFK